jgi:hypothetical protein
VRCGGYQPPAFQCGHAARLCHLHWESFGMTASGHKQTGHHDMGQVRFTPECVAKTIFTTRTSNIDSRTSTSAPWIQKHRSVGFDNCAFAALAAAGDALRDLGLPNDVGHSRRSDGQQGFAECPLCLNQRTDAMCANQRHSHRSKTARYSIISSARASTDAGTVRLSALAVLRLMTSSYFVGACTGMSAGFSPLRIRST